MKPTVLNGVILSPEAVYMWNESTCRAIQKSVKSGVKITAEDIGVEQIHYDPRRAKVRIVGYVGKIGVSLGVPDGFWTWAN